MPISGTLLADFSSFSNAVQKADAELRGFESGAGRVEKSLNQMADSFSGRKIIQEATLAAKAVEEIGGASKLTDSEARRLNGTVTEAIAKFKALGQTAPQSMVELQHATARTTPVVDQLNTRMVAMGTAIGSFVGNLAWSAVNKLGSEVAVFAQRGVQLQAVQTSFERLAVGVKQSADSMLSSMREGTRGLVADFDLMQQANKAMLLGLPVTSAEMGTLAKTATTLGRAMGQDATKSLDDLITALGRSSPMILDNLGLTVKIGEANELYAAKLGKTADSLTDAEKKTAFYAEAMRKAEIKTKELGEQADTLTDKLSRAWTTIGNAITRAASQVNIELGLTLTEMGNGTEGLKRIAAALAASGGQTDQYVAALTRMRDGTSTLNDTQAELAKRFLASGMGVKDVATMLGFSVAAVAALNTVTEKAVPAQASYAQQLAATREALNKLKPEQQSEIRAALELGEATDKIQERTGVAAKVIELFKERLQQQGQASKKTAEEAKKLAEETKRLEKAWNDMLQSLADESWNKVTAGVKQLDRALANDLSNTLKKLPNEIENFRKGVAFVESDWKHFAEDLTKDPPKAKKEIDKLGESFEGLSRAMSELAQISGDSFGGVVKDIAMTASAMNIAHKAGADLAKSIKDDTATWGDYAVSIMGAVAALDAATSGQSKSRNVLSGALTGASYGAAIGSAFPGVGTAVGAGVGAGVGALVGLFRDAKHATDQLDTELERQAKLIAASDDALGRYGATWKDLNPAAIASRLDAELARLLTDQESLVRAGVDGAAATRLQAGAYNELIGGLTKAGVKLEQMPGYLQGVIRNLATMGQLTEENTRLLLGMAETALPNWKAMEEAAALLGIPIENLGTAYEKSKLTDQIAASNAALQTLLEGGTDLGEILTHIGPDTVKSINDAIALGVEIPRQMKPLLEGLLDSGQLIGENGEALKDLQAIKFGETMAESTDRLIAKLDDVIVAFSQTIPDAIRATIDAASHLGDIDIPSVPGQDTYSTPLNVPVGDRAVQTAKSPSLVRLNPGGVSLLTPRGSSAAVVSIQVDARGAHFQDRRSLDDLTDKIVRRLGPRARALMGAS